jgi:hypothetical protein
MVDQAPANTTPQPAVQPPAAPTGGVSMDTLIPVKVDGREFQEPLSKVVASYQMQTAAERRFQEANRLLTQHKGDIDLASRIRTKIDSDPEGAILEMQRFAQERTGRPVRLPGAPSQDAGLGDQTTGNEAFQLAEARREAALRDLRSELDGLKTNQRVEATAKEIEVEVAKYPMFREQAERELAVLTISAMKGSRPDMSVSDLASEVHNRMSALATRQVTQVRDARQQRAESMPVAPTSGGTPQMTTAQPDGWGTKKALRDGTWQAKLREFMTSQGRTR